MFDEIRFQLDIIDLANIYISIPPHLQHQYLWYIQDEWQQIDDEFGFLIDLIFETLYSWTQTYRDQQANNKSYLSEQLVQTITLRIENLPEDLKWRVPILVQNLLNALQDCMS